MSQRVLIVGPGALGVIAAVRLKNAGHDVSAAARNAASAKALPKTWEAIDPEGVPTSADIRVVSKRGGPYDVLILATKCDDAPEALRRWLPELAADGAVVALQNGIIGDELANIAGDRLVECTVAFPATLLGPGRSEQTGSGSFIIGPWPDGRMDAATPLDPIAQLMVDIAPTHIHRNMQGVKWTKLCLNSGITGLGAMTGQTLGGLLASRQARTALIHIFTEAYRTGLAAGVQFEKVAGFHPRLAAVMKPNRLALARSHLVLTVMGRKFRRQRSSSLQSLERGRRTEVHHLNDFVVRTAAEHDLVAPVNAAVVARVQAIEAGAAKPGMQWLDELPYRFH